MAGSPLREADFAVFFKMVKDVPLPDLSEKSMSEYAKIKKEKIKNIIVLMIGGIGDILAATPTIRRLKQEFPSAVVSLIIREEFADLLTGNPDIDTLIFYAKNLKFFKKIRAQKYDLFLDLHAPTFNTICSNRRIYLRNSMICLCVRARYKVGFGLYGYNFFLTHPVPVNTKDELRSNIVDLTARALLPFGITGIIDKKKKVFPVPVDESSLKVKLEHSNINGKLFIVMHPFGNQSANYWPIESFSALVRELKRLTSDEVILIGSAGQREMCAQISASGSTHNFCGVLSIRETISLINSCRLFIGSDSGPMHIADALGKKSVCLFGAHGVKGVWEPVSENALVIRKDVSCAECLKKDCPDNICLKQISPQEVAQAVRKTLLRQ